MAETSTLSVLITYDASARQGEIKDAMVAKPYSDSFILGGVEPPTYILPNTTLWKANTATATALADLQAVVAALNTPYNPVRLERAVATVFSGISAIPGEKRK